MTDETLVLAWTGIIMPSGCYLATQLVKVEILKQLVAKQRFGVEDFLGIKKSSLETEWTPEMLQDVEKFYFPCFVFDIQLENGKGSKFVMVTEKELARVGMLPGIIP